MNAQLGERLKEQALTAVEQAHKDWVVIALQVVRDLCNSRPEFTTDDIWMYVEGIPAEPRAMGAVMRKAVKERLCEQTDRTIKSRRAQCHRRPIAVWRSKTYAP